MKLKDILANRLKEIGWSWYKLAKESGVHITSLYDMKSGRKDALSLQNTIKVFNALRLDLNELKKIDWEGNNDTYRD